MHKKNIIFVTISSWKTKFFQVSRGGGIHTTEAKVLTQAANILWLLNTQQRKKGFSRNKSRAEIQYKHFVETISSTSEENVKEAQEKLSDWGLVVHTGTQRNNKNPHCIILSLQAGRVQLIRIPIWLHYCLLIFFEESWSQQFWMMVTGNRFHGYSDEKRNRGHILPVQKQKCLSSVWLLQLYNSINLMAIPAWSVVEYKMSVVSLISIFYEVSKQWFGKLNRKSAIIF